MPTSQLWFSAVGSEVVKVIGQSVGGFHWQEIESCIWSGASHITEGLAPPGPEMAAPIRDCNTAHCRVFTWTLKMLPGNILPWYSTVILSTTHGLSTSMQDYAVEMWQFLQQRVIWKAHQEWNGAWCWLPASCQLTEPWARMSNVGPGCKPAACPDCPCSWGGIK